VALERAGEPTSALDQARLAGEDWQARRLEGLLRASDPGWLPELPRTALGPGPARQVLCLLEASLPHAPSGYAYRSRLLMRALSEAGYGPVAATRLGFPATRGVTDWERVETVDGVVHHRFGRRLRGGRRRRAEPLDLQLQENAELLLALAEQSPPSLVLAATPHLNGVLGLALRAATGVPLVYDVRGFPEMTLATRFGGAGSELYRLRRAAETRCASEADAVITLSETMRAELVARGVHRDRVSVVPHAVDTVALAPRDAPAELAGSYGLKGRFVVGCVSSLTHYEGIDLLLRAVSEARAENPDLAALIVGDGPARPALERLAAELGIEASVAFAGRVPHDAVADHYALLDLFALPRRDLEVCRAVTPLKPFEAMAMGVPLVVSDLAALAEIVDESGGGRRVAPEDQTGLARTIVELAADRSLRVELGSRGMEYARARHSEAAVAERLREALGSVPLASGPRPDERPWSLRRPPSGR
jgi:glycosyltransferase involved in cell wall biosynthesis